MKVLTLVTHIAPNLTAVVAELEILYRVNSSKVFLKLQLSI